MVYFFSSESPFSSPCSKLPLRMMREGDVFNGPTGFVVPKNCPFLHDLDFYVEHMVQGGIVQKLLYKDVSARSITMHIFSDTNRFPSYTLV